MPAPSCQSGFSDHAEQVRRALPAVQERAEAVQAALGSLQAFSQPQTARAINFAAMSADDLAAVLRTQPALLKGLLDVCGMAGRSLERDLGVKVDTYRPRLTAEVASRIAGLLLPLLPDVMLADTLVALDRRAMLSDVMRRQKGAWEREVQETLRRRSGQQFVKQRIFHAGAWYELDNALRDPRGRITAAIDVKRIEGRQDIHKRADEIRGRAEALHSHNPRAAFVAIIYFPFPELDRARRRIQAPPNYVTDVCFASELQSSLESAVRSALIAAGVKDSGAPIDAPPVEVEADLRLFDL